MADSESTLLIINEVYAYRIPPRASAAGHKAADWPDENLIWRGRLVVVERGEICVIKLITPSTGVVFAECPVNPGAVEGVLDSSRYFVLRIEDPRNGRHAFLGMGFQERGEAFDFNVTLQDHERRIKDMKELEKQRANAGPAKDYSIPVGQTITVNLKSTPKAATSHTTSSHTTSSGSNNGGFTGFLPPPPGSRSRQRQQQHAAAPAPAPAAPAANNGMWSDFTSAF